MEIPLAMQFHLVQELSKRYSVSWGETEYPSTTISKDNETWPQKTLKTNKGFSESSSATSKKDNEYKQ